MLHQHQHWKFNLVVKFLFRKADGTVYSFVHTTQPYTAVAGDPAVPQEVFDVLSQRVSDMVGNLNAEGSGSELRAVVFARLECVAFDPMVGGCPGELPARVQHKGAPVSVQSSEQDCFKWSVLACKHPADRNPQRHSHYVQHVDAELWSDVPFPTPIGDVGVFERKTGWPINVFGIQHVHAGPDGQGDDWEVVVLRHTKLSGSADNPVVNLLFSQGALLGYTGSVSAVQHCTCAQEPHLHPLSVGLSQCCPPGCTPGAVWLC